MVTGIPPLPRRNILNLFLGGGILGMAASITYPVIRFLMPTKHPASNVGAVLAAKKSELKPNSGKIFRFGNQPAILIRTPSGEFRAFSAICTHLACTVQYRQDLEHIWCACHNGHYDLQGRNIAGPPPRPLDAYEVKERGEEIFVTKKA